MAALLFVAPAQSADDDEEEEKIEELPKESAELARKYAAVVSWRGFFQTSETGSISWTGFYSYGAQTVEFASHGQFTLERSEDWSGEDVRRGVLTWKTGNNNTVCGERTVSYDQEISNWDFKGTGSERRMQASGTLPMAATEFTIWLPSKKRNSTLVHVHPGAGSAGKRTIARTVTGRSVWDESDGKGQNVRRTRSLDETTQTDAFVTWYGPVGEAAEAPWHQVMRAGPGVLVFPFESTTRADTQISTPVLTRRSVVILAPIYDDVEVEVTIAGYAKWRPKGSIKAPTQPGNHLIARATLVPKDGVKPKDVPNVKNFRFRLIETSREPGICLNWPLDAKDADFDLRLAAAPGFAAELSDKDQTNKVAKPLSDPKGRLYAESQVDSFDFGGKAILSVVCELEDGRQIIGLIKEGDRTNLVRLPKREGPDWIAQSWRDLKKIGTLSASTDDDNEPLGDGTKGDGLTLYEEYRGWVENGEHIEGEPKIKDFFIQMEKARVALLGVGKFQRITGLNVHYQFKETEFPASRIMNANREHGPNVTAQHGVVVQVMKNQPGVSRAVGGPRNPKFIQSVNLMSDIADYGANYVASTVAHELGHCVNLWHHGDDDCKVIWAVIDGKLYEGRNNSVTEILVRNEEGDDCTDVIIEEALAIQALPAPGNRLKYQMGVDHGQHSGDDNCVMRYDDAQTFIYRILPQHRFINFTEPVGKELCASGEGTGVNHKDRVSMQPRYGPALAGRGDCVHQILVNDAGEAPYRRKSPRPKP